MNVLTSDRRLRVVHLPARTPYVWKLQSRDFRIVNGSTLDDGSVVPAAVTADWILEQTPLTWLDVLHLHHVEFEPTASLERLLDACGRSGVHVVQTVHDTHAMFGDDHELQKRFVLLAAAGVSWVCLTHGAARELTEQIGWSARISVIPHGYVADPNHIDDKQRHSEVARQRFLLFGSARPNRDQLSTVVNWSLATSSPESSLHLLMRGLSPVNFNEPSSQQPQLLNTISADHRITATMRSYPSDSEVIDAGVCADALLLPYLWGTHSGQLELAFDLNLLPVCSSVGHLKEQRDKHGVLVTDPEWFDWSSGNQYLFGERFVAALERAAERLVTEPRQLSAEFIDYRRCEHEYVLDAYRDIYNDRPQP